MIKKDKVAKILTESGLWTELSKIGVPHMIGSCRMDLMVSNDIDIDIENDNMSLEKLYQLTAYILREFSPKWYEAKEEINDEGKTVWFQGFEVIIDGDLWNFDLWFFDKGTIKKAEKFCDDIKGITDNNLYLKNCIIKLKEELIKRELYSYETYTSMDVYRAVIDQKIYDINEFLTKYIK